MKCKVCGAQNPDYLEYCENCAALLEGSAEVPTTSVPKSGDSAWGFARAPQWPQPDFNANTITEEEIPAEYVQRYGDNDSAPVKNAAEAPQAVSAEEEYYEEEPVQVRPRTRVNKAVPQPRYDDEDDYGQEDDEEYQAAPVPRRSSSNDEQFFDYDRRKYSGKRRSSSKRSHSSRSKTILFYGAAGLLVVIIAVLLVVFLTRGGKDDEQAGAPVSAAQPAETEVETEAIDSQQKPAFLGGLFSKSPITKPATIEKDTTGSETAYIITVYTKSNCTYRFTAGTLINEGAVDGRSVSLRIPEQVWMPTGPVDGEVYQVTPDVVIMNKDGEETQVEFAEAISITLPTLTLTLVNPLETSLSVSAPNVDIAGTVDNNTAEVFVNDMQLPVDSTGNFAGSYTLPGVGTQVVNVEARKNGYAIARKTLNIEYATDVAAEGAAAAAAGVASESGTPSFAISADLVRRTTSAALTVSGTVEAGATLSVDGVTLNGQITTNATAGTFEFTVDMQEVGLYTAVITSNKGGVTGSRTVYLERSHADSDEYMENCHALDYQYLRDSPYHKQGYMISGKVVEILQTTPFIIARMTTDAGDIVFQYYNTVATVEANDGKTYKVYADPYGRFETDPDVPVVYAWYIKKSG